MQHFGFAVYKMKKETRLSCEKIHYFKKKYREYLCTNGEKRERMLLPNIMEQEQR